MKNQVRLNLGCGIVLSKGWINVDNYFNKEDLEDGIKTGKGIWRKAVVEEGAEFVRADIHKLPFPDNYADYVLLDNVIEHISHRTVLNVLKEINRVMKKGATLKLITPDADALALSWMKMAINTFDLDTYIYNMKSILGSHDHEGEYHKCLFNSYFLNYFLVIAGFTDGKIMRFGKGAPTELDGIGLREQLGGVYAFDWLVAIVQK